MPTTQEAQRYRDHLLTANPKYAPDRQLLLKQRVVETFQTLIQYAVSCDPVRYPQGQEGLVPGTRLLDLGSADGAFVSVCRNRGLRATGLDIHQGVNLESDHLPIPDVSYDVVTAIALIEHLYSPANLLAEVRRVLVFGGWFILVCPNWRFTQASFYDDPTHVHPYTEVSLRKVLQSYGYKGVTVVPWLVKKSTWWWRLPCPFFAARYLIPFPGTAPTWIPSWLKGRSGSLLAICHT